MCLLSLCSQSDQSDVRKRREKLLLRVTGQAADSDSDPTAEDQAEQAVATGTDQVVPINAATNAAPNIIVNYISKFSSALSSLSMVLGAV